MGLIRYIFFLNPKWRNISSHILTPHIGKHIFDYLCFKSSHSRSPKSRSPIFIWGLSTSRAPGVLCSQQRSNGFENFLGADVRGWLYTPALISSHGSNVTPLTRLRWREPVFVTRWYRDICFFFARYLCEFQTDMVLPKTRFSRRLIRGLGVSDVGVQVWSSAGGWYQSVGSSVLFHVSRVPWWCGVLQAELLSTWLMTLGDLKSRGTFRCHTDTVLLSNYQRFNVEIPILNHPQSRFIIGIYWVWLGFWDDVK